MENYNNHTESERVKAVDDIFENTGLHWIITDDIQAEIWGKFKLNVCNNLPQAILGVGVGCYEDSEHMAAIRDGLRAEVEAVAKAKGIDLSMINAKSGRGVRSKHLQDTRHYRILILVAIQRLICSLVQ